MNVLNEFFSFRECFFRRRLQQVNCAIVSRRIPAVQRQMMADVTSVNPLQFSIIVDGTRDVSGVEQESICMRFVDDNLTPD